MSIDQNVDYGWRSATPECSVPYTLPAILPILGAHSVKSILDLGCGNGGLTAELAKAGFEVVGCDRDEEGISIARQAHPDVNFQLIGFDDIPSRIRRKFDAVISTEVIEHLYDPASMLRCARKMLERNGLLLVTTPHYGFAKQVAIVAGGLWEEHHQVSRVGGHIKHFSPRAMRQILDEEGFSANRIGGAGRFWPLWKTMVVEAKANGSNGNA